VSSDKLTVPEKLLIAAFELHQRASPTFTAEDLVVSAWTKYPDTFGLSGYSDRYPDSNRVLTNIMGTKGMRGKGWLRKVGEKQYRLTPTALNEAERLAAHQEAPGSVSQLRAELDRRATAALERLATSAAARKAFTEQSEAISFYDACGFWDITVRSNANTLVARLNDTGVLLERVAALLDDKSNADGLKLGNMNVTKKQVEQLRALHVDMQQRFKSDLDVLRERTDERVGKRRVRL